ncbi:hypothetical protein KCP74_20565 [Salmonella enterica subsp. enterica]|nr:hypothetical protein KCP74_20565 [Salmonella enterica subsp. enterica]
MSVSYSRYSTAVSPLFSTGLHPIGIPERTSINMLHHRSIGLRRRVLKRPASNIHTPAAPVDRRLYF